MADASSAPFLGSEAWLGADEYEPGSVLHTRATQFLEAINWNVLAGIASKHRGHEPHHACLPSGQNLHQRSGYNSRLGTYRDNDHGGILVLFPQVVETLDSVQASSSGGRLLMVSAFWIVIHMCNYHDS